MSELQNNPSAMLMAQITVQNSMIEYLLACIMRPAPKDQVKLIENSIRQILRDRVEEELPDIVDFNHTQYRLLAESILEGNLASVRAMLKRG